MIRAKDVWEDQENIRETRLSAMKAVIPQIVMNIKRQYVHNPKSPYIMFEVPSFVFGFPIYTMEEATEYLSTQLISAGYWVWIVDTKYLLISWLKPVKTRDGGKPILTTNYRPMVYDPTLLPKL